MAENKQRGPHQAKNKPTEILGSSDSIFGGSVSVANPNASADERKTVILDSDLEGLEFEDRVWLYWKRNKNFIYLCVAVLFASIILSNGWRMYVNHRNAVLANGFAQATNFDERAAFAKSNSGTSASGAALLQNADELFEAGKFAEAAKCYLDASENLKGTILAGRAKIGEAFSYLKAGDKEKALSVLEATANNLEYSANSAEASYHLGVLAFAQNKSEDAKKYFEAVLSNKDAGRWADLASNYLQRL